MINNKLTVSGLRPYGALGAKLFCPKIFSKVGIISPKMEVSLKKVFKY